MFRSLEIAVKQIVKSSLPKCLVKFVFHNEMVSHFRVWVFFHWRLKATLKNQLDNKHSASKAQSTLSNLKILVPLIETNHYQFHQILILAKALQQRGAHVKVLVCGQELFGCEIKSQRNEYQMDPCWLCRFNQNNILNLFELETIRIADVLGANKIQSLGDEASNLVTTDSNKIVRYGVDLFRCVNDSVVRYFYGCLPEDGPKVSNVRLAHTKTALMSIEIAKIIDENWKPDIVFNNMGGYSAWGPYIQYFEKYGNRYRTISITPLDYSCVRFNILDILKSTDRFRAYICTRHDQKLSQEEKEDLSRFLELRVTNRSAIFRDLAMFADTTGDLINKLEIDKGRRNIFLFLNIHWDVGLSENGDLYSDPIALALDAIELCKEFSDCQLYIKPHPGDAFGTKSAKGISEVIKERYPILPKNITIIEPEWRIKPYELFPFIDIGVIFTGTLGLEMMLAGIPVISTGLTSHKGLGFAAEPETIDSYRALLLGEAPTPLVDQEQLELFAYFYFIRTLIPWTLTKQAYADDFDGFAFKTLSDLQPGRDPYLDHLCNCILDPENTVPEAWPQRSAVSPH